MILRRAWVATILCGALLAGCGGSDDGGDSSRAAPPAASFPQVDGRSLTQVFAGIDASSLVVSPAAQVFEPGPNRYPFGVFTAGRRQVNDVEVAIYAAPGPNQPAIGPFPARVDSLRTPPAFRGRTTAADDATGVYVVPKLPIRSNGPLFLVAMIRRDGALEATQIPTLVAGRFSEIPGPGERAPRVRTPTIQDVGDISQIDTRVPPDTMHEVDFADALGRRPAVLLFATPQFCQSRVCGPVVDIAEQVKQGLGDRAAFIHMEVYRDNDPNKGPRPEFRAFGLESEPFLFVVDANGVIRTRIEGAFGAEELERAVREVS